MNFKRVLIGSDMHCGHRVGLTPPRFQSAIHGYKYHRIQEECYRLYRQIIYELKPIDVYIHNGDAIDGAGGRSGATELIVVDMNKQAEMAEICIKEVGAKDVIMTRGTAYHVSPEGQDTEDIVAKNSEVTKIGDHEWIDINGVIFDFKHHIGGTSVPYTKGTAVAKDRLWNVLWAEHEEQPKADVVVRSHIHNFYFCGDHNWMGITTPALQAMGSKFGARRCSAIVHWGMVHFDIFEDGTYRWQPHIYLVESQKATLTKL